mmetsp:Transcript_23485/g.55642  ORF Transcript_23485/g.55642 Transcript_23485/m.55642 type:complete len:85 (+) Transcript_23485:533-787(+)
MSHRQASSSFAAAVFADAAVESGNFHPGHYRRRYYTPLLTWYHRVESTTIECKDCNYLNQTSFVVVLVLIVNVSSNLGNYDPMK